MPVSRSDDVIKQIGNTPLVRLSRFEESGSAALWGKVEAFNPGGSIKDRICLSMIEAAEKDGCLKPGATVLSHQRQYRHRSLHGLCRQGL